MPDAVVPPASLTEFRNVLEVSGSFTSFATEYLHDHKVTDGWELPDEALDKFEAWLAERRIQPNVHEWISNHDYIAYRLKTELYNQSLGVEKGDEIEMQFDPQVQRAMEEVTRSR